MPPRVLRGRLFINLERGMFRQKSGCNPISRALRGEENRCARRGSRRAQSSVRTKSDRQETCGRLVFAPRTGFEALQTFAQAIIQDLVVADLEVQAVEMSGAAPMTAVERAGARKLMAPAT